MLRGAATGRRRQWPAAGPWPSSRTCTRPDAATPAARRGALRAFSSPSPSSSPNTGLPQLGCARRSRRYTGRPCASLRSPRVHFEIAAGGGCGRHDARAEEVAHDPVSRGPVVASVRMVRRADRGQGQVQPLALRCSNGGACLAGAGGVLPRDAPRHPPAGSGRTRPKEGSPLPFGHTRLPLGDPDRHR